MIESGRDVVRIGGEPMITTDAQIRRQRELDAAAASYAERALAAASKRAYASDWRHFAAWCARHGYAPLPAPPPVIARWIADVAGRHAAATLERRRITIRKRHVEAGYRDPFNDPTVARIWRGVRRTHGIARKPKAAFSTSELRQAVVALPDSLAGVRDRAILLLCFASALRRSELVALDVADLAFARDGVRLTIRRSKTDTQGRGAVLTVAYGRHRETCPVTALRTWLRAASIRRGPLFRNLAGGALTAETATRRLGAAHVARVVKAAARRIGLDPSHYSAHSLRRGFCTEALRGGATEAATMKAARLRTNDALRDHLDDSRWDAPAARVLDL